MVYALLFASPVANRDFYVCDDDTLKQKVLQVVICNIFCLNIQIYHSTFFLCGMNTSGVLADNMLSPSIASGIVTELRIQIFYNFVP
jgi:hypothetical protein